MAIIATHLSANPALTGLPSVPFVDTSLRSATGELPPRLRVRGRRRLRAMCGYVRTHIRTSSSSAFRTEDGVRAPVKPARRKSVEAGQRPLEKCHSHFFFVTEDEHGSADIIQPTAMPLRSKFEAEIRQADLAGVGLTTPVLVVLVEDGAAAHQSPRQPRKQRRGCGVAWNRRRCARRLLCGWMPAKRYLPAMIRTRRVRGENSEALYRKF